MFLLVVWLTAAQIAAPDRSYNGPLPNEMAAEAPFPGKDMLLRVTLARRLYNECLSQEVRRYYDGKRSVHEIVGLARVGCSPDREAALRAYQAMQRAVGPAADPNEVLRGMGELDIDSYEHMNSLIDHERLMQDTAPKR